jgi:hypothetical protein
MTSPRCTGEPISWLRLERYHANELSPEARGTIGEHLASCPACAECLARIERDEAVVLPALPSAARERSEPAKRSAANKVVPLFSPAVKAAIGGLAVAAAVAVGIGRGAWKPPAPGQGEIAEATRVRVKGGTVAFTLVRDDSERIEGAHGVYRDGDRFKVLVTCPPGYGASFDVAVLEAGASQAAFPLGSPPSFACGNEAPLPGAMRLTGSARETVCVAWSEEGPVDRAIFASLGEGGRGATDRTRSLCKELEPAR